MNTIINQINTFLAKYLDALKVKSPILFIAIQGLLSTILFLFAKGTVHLPNPEFLTNIGVNLEGFLIAIISGLIALTAPRTTSFLK